MDVPVRVSAIFLAILLVLEPSLAQDSNPGPGFDILQNIFNHQQCRKGLCPYVKRLIPHIGYGMAHGHGHDHEHEPPSLCGNLCATDLACPGYQKCCPTHCGYACLDPVHVAEY